MGLGSSNPEHAPGVTDRWLKLARDQKDPSLSLSVAHHQHLLEPGPVTFKTQRRLNTILVRIHSREILTSKQAELWVRSKAGRSQWAGRMRRTGKRASVGEAQSKHGEQLHQSRGHRVNLLSLHCWVSQTSTSHCLFCLLCSGSPFL